MQIRVLGAHNLESRTTRHACLLVDGVLGLDAGSLASALTLGEQRRVRALLLTHGHFDHIRDLPTLGLAMLDEPHDIEVFGLPYTLDSVRKHLMDGDVYPDMTKGLNSDTPKYRLTPVRVDKPFKALGYDVTPVPASHPLPAAGYIVRDGSGASVAYTGDTGGDLSPFFRHGPAPDVLFVDVTFPDRLEQRAELTGHLTPKLLRLRLEDLLRAGIALPKIAPIHVSAILGDEVAGELGRVGAALGIDLGPATEDMVINL